MKKILIGTLVGAFVLALLAIPISADKGGTNANCVKIKDGILTYSAGHYLYPQPLKVGFDPFGYNYQAHIFKGSYANAYLGRDHYPPYTGDDDAYLAENPGAESMWYWPNRDIKLIMWWSDTWLSNKDCNGDGDLDRGYSCDPINANSSACPGAWLTNHQWGSYEGDNGKICKWNYFVKIVAAPADAYKVPANANGSTIPGIWYTADGIEIGPVIWGSFAVIMRVYNDPCAGDHGIEYLSPVGPGFGKFKP